MLVTFSYIGDKISNVIISVTNIHQLIESFNETRPEFSLSGASSPWITRHPKIKNPKIISQKLIFMVFKVLKFSIDEER